MRAFRKFPQHKAIRETNNTVNNLKHNKIVAHFLGALGPNPSLLVFMMRPVVVMSPLPLPRCKFDVFTASSSHTGACRSRSLACHSMVYVAHSSHAVLGRIAVAPCFPPHARSGMKMPPCRLAGSWHREYLHDPCVVAASCAHMEAPYTHVEAHASWRVLDFDGMEGTPCPSAY